jgi:S-adenosylmethionine hydrolase
VAVIDPGVGGQRRPVLLKIEDQFYIGPDNGILGLLLEDFLLQGAWMLDNRKYFLSSVSQTFHGRDVFAPVAAHLAGGTPPEAFGPTIGDPVRIELPPHREERLRLKGVVVWIDRFGNCITNLTDKLVLRWAKGAPFVVHAASKKITGICSSYDTTPKGEALAIFNSMGFLEIACNQEQADRTLGLGEGDPVVLAKVSTQEALEGDT